MTKEREALKLALEALDKHDYEMADHILWKALAQPEQEPVACPYCKNSATLGAVYYDQNCVGCVKRMTAPPHCKPLSDVEIWNTYKNLWMFHPAEEPRLAGDVLKFARAIEQAHGIKE